MTLAPTVVASLSLVAMGAAKRVHLPATPEAEIGRAVQHAYRAAHQPPPAIDRTLSAAARAQAERALAGGVKAATDSGTVAESMSRAGSWDPPPRVIALRTSPPENAARAAAARADLASMPATHLGIGLASKNSDGAVVLLFTVRRAVLEPFPRRVAVGRTATLEGRLELPLYDAQIVVAGPKGVQRPQPFETGARSRFAAEIRFPAPGRYTVEVVAQSIKGPEVAALFHVQAGPGDEVAAPTEERAERDDLAKAEAQVLSALNARRRAAGLKALARSSLLDKVASEHSAEMARMGYFAHVSPRSGDAAERASRAGLRFQKIAENIGEAATALDAEKAIESSPGHLANILDPYVDQVGLGTSRVRRGDIDNLLLTEVFARAEP